MRSGSHSETTRDGRFPCASSQTVSVRPRPGPDPARLPLAPLRDKRTSGRGKVEREGEQNRAKRGQPKRGKMMSGGFLRSGGRRAHQLLLHHSRPSLADALSKHSPSRAYVRSHLLSSKFKEPSSQIFPASPSLFSSSYSVPFASAASNFSRNGFVSWYLGMIETRPVLTKSLTAGSIFIAADVSSQVCVLFSVSVSSVSFYKNPILAACFSAGSAGFGIWMCMERNKRDVS